MDPLNKKEEIMQRYLELPEDVQNALFAKETSDAIVEIGKKHGLTIDKVGELADETGLVMLGIVPPAAFIKNLVRRLGVEQEKARAIAEDTNQKVFSPVRESLKKIHGIQPETVKPPTPPIAPTIFTETKPTTQSEVKIPIQKMAPPPIKAPESKPPENLPPEIRTMESDRKKIPADQAELPSIFVRKIPRMEMASP